MTNQNQHFDVGKNVNGQNKYPIQIGPGILAGVCGRKGTEIDVLALIFLRPQVRKMPGGDEPVLCTASAVYGEDEFPYTSKTTLLFVNPTASLSYTEKGLFKTQQWANATAKAEIPRAWCPPLQRPRGVQRLQLATCSTSTSTRIYGS